jgi:hypothetical protein
VADPSADGTVGTDNTFRLSGLLGKVRFTAIGVPPQWMLKTITVGDTDLTTTGIDAASLGVDARVRVVLADVVTELTGSVRNAQGEPVPEYVVVVLPVEAVNPAIASRYTHALRPDQKGAFRLGALPPGNYVVDALEQGSEWDPAFQAAVRNGARRFTMSEGNADSRFDAVTWEHALAVSVRRSVRIHGFAGSQVRGFGATTLKLFAKHAHRRCPSTVAQRRDRIDTGSTARGKPGGKRGDRRKQE